MEVKTNSRNTETSRRINSQEYLLHENNKKKDQLMGDAWTSGVNVFMASVSNSSLIVPADFLLNPQPLPSVFLLVSFLPFSFFLTQNLQYHNFG